MTVQSKKATIKTPEEVTNLVEGRLKDKQKEHFLVLLLDILNQLIKISEVSIGSLDTSIVHLMTKEMGIEHHQCESNLHLSLRTIDPINKNTRYYHTHPKL